MSTNGKFRFCVCVVCLFLLSLGSQFNPTMFVCSAYIPFRVAQALFHVSSFSVYVAVLFIAIRAGSKNFVSSAVYQQLRREAGLKTA